jgi:hypothetical protein
VETPAKVTGYLGPEQLGDAVVDSDIVVIPAGEFKTVHEGTR